MVNLLGSQENSLVISAQDLDVYQSPALLGRSVPPGRAYE